MEGLFCHQFFWCVNTRQSQAALTQKLFHPTQNHRESLAICLLIQQKGEPGSGGGFRRRDANGCGRYGRAPEEVADDWGTVLKCEFGLGRRRPWIYSRVVSDLLAGLLGALLATNSPQAVSNLVAEKTGLPLPVTTVVSTNDPDENEFHRVLLDDDAAEKEVLGWMDNADAFTKAGGGKPSPTLNLKIQQRLDGIKKEYQDFIERHPKHVNARLAFGSFLNDNHDEEGAFTQWDTARQLDPTNPAAWDDLGNYYVFSQQALVKKAFDCYDKAIELNPGQSVYYHNLAVTVYMYRKDAREYYHLEEQQVFDKALALYRQAIKLDPDNFVLFTDYAESFYGTNPPRWKDGLEAWTEALKIAHDDGEREGVYIHLARIHLKLGDYDQARANLDAVTNANYAAFKERLTRNLNAALDKAKTNAPPSTAGGK